VNTSLRCERTPIPKMKLTMLILTLMTLMRLPVPGICSDHAARQSDEESIREAALNYIEGWYDGDSVRVESSLHPELAKRMVQTDKNGRSQLNQMSAMTLVQNTRLGGGKKTPLKRQIKEVKILDVFENAASVRIDASDWVDYLHVVKYNGKWVIINVLWELKVASK